MRLYSFEYDGQARIGAEQDKRLIELSFANMLELIRGGEAALVQARAEAAAAAPGAGYPLAAVRLRAPIDNPGKRGVWRARTRVVDTPQR
jgi:hypothetical protein